MSSAPSRECFVARSRGIELNFSNLTMPAGTPVKSDNCMIVAEFALAASRLEPATRKVEMHSASNSVGACGSLCLWEPVHVGASWQESGDFKLMFHAKRMQSRNILSRNLDTPLEVSNDDNGKGNQKNSGKRDFSAYE